MPAILVEGLVGLIASIAPWVLAWFALGGNAHSVQKNVEEFGQSITQGPVNTAVNAWIKVLFIGAGVGFFFWVAEVESSKRLGVAPPATPNFAPPSPTAPTFGASGGYGVSAGPISVHSGVTAGNAPAPRAAPARRSGSTFRGRRR